MNMNRRQFLLLTAGMVAGLLKPWATVAARLQVEERIINAWNSPATMPPTEFTIIFVTRDFRGSSGE